MMKKPVKVAILVNELLRGGAQRIILDMVRGLDRADFEIVVVCMKDAGVFGEHGATSLHASFEATGVRVVSVAHRREWSFGEFFRLYTILRAEAPDIVHTFLPYAGVIGRVIARMAGIQKTISTQCNVRVAYGFKEYWMDRLTLSLAHAWTAAAEGIEMEYGGSVTYWSEQAWQEGRRHYTLTGGVDCSAVDAALSHLDRAAKRAELGLRDGESMVMMTARLVSWKGHEDIIDALALVPPNMHLYLAGWGNRHQTLVRRAESLGIQDRVHFLGSRSDVYELLGAADVYVQAYSRTPEGRVWMGPSLSQMEACAAGVPSVSTRVPLIERLIEDGVTGKIAELNDPKSIAAAIEWIVGHPVEARRMAKRARTRVEENYSIRSMVSAYRSLYEHIA